MIKPTLSKRIFFGFIGIRVCFIAVRGERLHGSPIPAGSDYLRDFRDMGQTARRTLV